MATNPVITIADIARKHPSPEWVFPIREFQTPGSGCERFRGDQAPDLKGRIVVSTAVLKMIALVNQERMETGLTKLEMDATLMRLAEEKSWDMVRFNYFGHHSNRLGTIYDQLDRAQYRYQTAAENLIGAPNPIRAIQTVFSSPAHRGNILNPRFRKIGIGIVRGGSYGEMIVQILVDS
jgi:uncharacterized protein YkwD